MAHLNRAWFVPKHGEAPSGARRATREYRAWMGMKRRCYFTSGHNYANYGGRGIVMCDRWRTDYPAFLADMGRCPPKFTLDRISTDGNYEPGNCRWAPMIDQLNNKRSNKRIEFRGETKTLAQWERALGFNSGTLRRRLLKGWDTDRALSQPLR